MTGKLYAESLRHPHGEGKRIGMECLDDIPRAFGFSPGGIVRYAPKLQRKYIEALGGVRTLIEIDTCHCLMVSEPKRLAEILVDRCRLYA